MKFSKPKLAVISLSVLGLLFVAVLLYQGRAPLLKVNFLNATNDASGLAYGVFRLENKSKEVFVPELGFLQREGAPDWCVKPVSERVAPGADYVFQVRVLTNEPCRLVLQCRPVSLARKTRLVGLIDFIALRQPWKGFYASPLGRWRMRLLGYQYPTSASFISSASNKPDEADRRQPLSHREWLGPGGFAGSTAAQAHLER